ncbi:MAG: 50S ribosomal protein L10 [Mahellales bacterium]
MPINRKTKEQIVSQLSSDLKTANAAIFVDYKGLTVEEATELRRQFREAGVDYRVVKNTLTKIALEDLGYNDLVSYMTGPTAVAISQNDPVAPAKVLSDFIKKHKKMEFKVGFVDGKLINVDEIKDLAELPPREVLMAKLLGSMNSPISSLVNVLQGNIRNLVYTLNAIKEKKEA